MTAYILWNFFLFVVMFMDKYNSGRRVPERFLLSSAFFMGGIGICLGMYCFRHKTRHWQFKLLVPVAILINLVMLHFLHQ